jgi:hypothetical protein
MTALTPHDGAAVHLGLGNGALGGVFALPASITARVTSTVIHFTFATSDWLRPSQ